MPCKQEVLGSIPSGSISERIRLRISSDDQEDSDPETASKTTSVFVLSRSGSIAGDAHDEPGSNLGPVGCKRKTSNRT